MGEVIKLNTTTQKICQVLCKDCQNVLNRERRIWPFKPKLVTAYRWKCSAQIKHDCRDGRSYYSDCNNYQGGCEQFTPLNEDDFDPYEHIIGELE